MSEIREDIITGDHVVIASKRGKRPHDFDHDDTTNKGGYCPFCYGNEEDTPPEILAVSDLPDRKENDSGWRIRVVPNKFAALDIDEELKKDKAGIYNKLSGVGAAEVVIESADHDSSLGSHDLNHVKDIIKTLKKRYIDLATKDKLEYIQIFKNFGGTAGASLEHPHWQIMSTPLVPTVINNELEGAKDYYQENGNCVYCDIVEYELDFTDRMIAEGEEVVAFAPYASRYPFEICVMPKEHQSCFGEITEDEVSDLANILQEMIRKLEVGFDYPPYNIVLHVAPLDNDEETYHWHFEILPRLSITAGFELGTGSFINPTPPEVAAKSLREIDNI